MPVTIRLDSTMSQVPENIENKALWNQLLELTKLIDEKFESKFRVSAKFDDSLADNFSILVWNNSHGISHVESCDKENKALIEYLKEYGGQVTKSNVPFLSFFQSNSIVTLNTSLLNDIIENIKLKSKESLILN